MTENPSFAPADPGNTIAVASFGNPRPPQEEQVQALLGDAHGDKALIVEDMRLAEAELRDVGFDCCRITHNELMSSVGVSYLGQLMRGDFKLLWISTQSDWQVRRENLIWTLLATDQQSLAQSSRNWDSARALWTLWLFVDSANHSGNLTDWWVFLCQNAML